MPVRHRDATPGVSGQLCQIGLSGAADCCVWRPTALTPEPSQDRDRGLRGRVRGMDGHAGRALLDVVSALAECLPAFPLQPRRQSASSARQSLGGPASGNAPNWRGLDLVAKSSSTLSPSVAAEQAARQDQVTQAVAAPASRCTRRIGDEKLERLSGNVVRKRDAVVLHDLYESAAARRGSRAGFTTKTCVGIPPTAASPDSPATPTSFTGSNRPREGWRWAEQVQHVGHLRGELERRVSTHSGRNGHPNAPRVSERDHRDLALDRGLHHGRGDRRADHDVRGQSL